MLARERCLVSQERDDETGVFPRLREGASLPSSGTGATGILARGHHAGHELGSHLAPFGRSGIVGGITARLTRLGVLG